MFAALANHHGDDDTARHFLLNAGLGRQPRTIAYGRHLARQLGIAHEFLNQSHSETGVVRCSTPFAPNSPAAAGTEPHRSLRPAATEWTESGLGPPGLVVVTQSPPGNQAGPDRLLFRDEADRG